MKFPSVPAFIVGWQATQKCDVKYIVKKMDFFSESFYLIPRDSKVNPGFLLSPGVPAYSKVPH